MGIQHLQQQVIQRYHVLPLHAVEVVHAFVAAQGEEEFGQEEEGILGKAPEVLPQMADVREQHEQVGEAGVLLPEREAGLGDGPHQSIRHGVQELQQLVAALQLLAALS